MCFSAPASFIAGAALTATGIATVKKVRHKSEIPFACIPLFFGIQQLIEGFVWLGFNSDNSICHALATHGFSFFAYIFWPIFIPYSVYVMERIEWRKKVIGLFTLVGIGVSAYLSYIIIAFPVASRIVNASIVYDTANPFGFGILLPYILATCVCPLFSSHKTGRMAGLLIFFSAVVSYEFYSVQFVSVWCFFSAIVSLLIFDFFLQRHKRNIP